ncbi:MAG TPA: alpha/beta hydrolase [Gaiellales bacterium]|jgi:pimeloyl-ACP methyl ester carboxylesterase|nr:alpha/beta hydrolase [Gaiellales bacterium]
MLWVASDVAYPGGIDAATNLHATIWGEGPRAVLVHGSMSFGELAFSEQRPLAERWRLELLDRRGYGASPERPGRVDFAEDARDLAALLGEPAHLLGHSYGGIVCLLAAALRPQGARSLTVIEPPAFAVARGNPAVEEVVARIDRHFAAGQRLDEEAFLAGFLRAWGFEEPASRTLAPRARRGVRSSMTERMPWEAEIPLDVLAAADLPVLVARGAWDAVEPGARELAGAAFAAVCDVLAARLGAQLAVFPGAAHQPQLLGAPFNDRVEAFWRASEPA